MTFQLHVIAGEYRAQRRIGVAEIAHERAIASPASPFYLRLLADLDCGPARAGKDMESNVAASGPGYVHLAAPRLPM
jgi:hypothetical protein